MDDAQIPAVLRRRPQWVVWRTETRDGKPTKVPIDPGTGEYASVTDAATWTDYATAQAYADETDAVEGIGFVFTAEDPYAGVDLDECRDPETGDVEAWATEIVRELASYTEYSPSGTGLHVIVEGTIPSGGNRTAHLELYDENRYFTVTGRRVPGAPTAIEKRDGVLRAVHEEYIGSTKPEADANEVPPTKPLSVSDDALLAKARNAANGEKFQALWNGDTSGYDSHSEADQALCTLLAFWTGGDPQRIERLFARSGLVRAKWRDRSDYRERTIRTAVRHCSAFYEPDAEE
jgi:primase-polymerase (primpol)-like protein